MDMTPERETRNRVSRRRFLQVSAGLAAGAGVIPRGHAAPEPDPSDPEVILAQDGRPAAAIVIARNPTPNAKRASAELQRYVARMSGAQLPIAADDGRPGGTLILVGESRLTREVSGVKIPSGRTRDLRDEGYVILVRPGMVLLAGNDTEPYFGTRYAVCDMLHRLGVRWMMPGPIGEVVPSRSTVSIPQMHREERPDFPMRGFWEHSRGNMAADLEEWKIHNRMNPQMQDWFGIPLDGSLVGFLPPEEQVKVHPDWFALRRDGSRDPHMACMTSPEMVAWMVGKVKEQARAGKRVTSFAPEDGVPRCYCDRCSRVSSAFDGYGANERDPAPESSTSQEWFYFVDQILKGVNAEFPDHWIATNGYSNRELAPDLPDFNPRKNLVVMFANIDACTIHSYDTPHCWQMQR